MYTAALTPKRETGIVRRLQTRRTYGGGRSEAVSGSAVAIKYVARYTGELQEIIDDSFDYTLTGRVICRIKMMGVYCVALFRTIRNG